MLASVAGCSQDKENRAASECSAAETNACSTFDGTTAVQPRSNSSHAAGTRTPAVVSPLPSGRPSADVPASPSPTLEVAPGGTIATITMTASAGGLAGVTRIDIRKLAGTAAPANCDAGALLFSGSSQVVHTTDASWPGEPQSYRACFYGAKGLIAHAVAAQALPRGHHTIFVSSEAFTGNLKAGAYGHSAAFANGKEGADFRCQHLATAAGRDGSWKALLTTSVAEAAEKAFTHRIYGEIYNSKREPQKVAGDHEALWSGTELLADLNADEYGEVAGGEAWTGTSPQGAYYYSCSDFTSESGSGYYGQPTEVNGSWTLHGAVHCNEKRRLYCIDSVPEALTIEQTTDLQISAGLTPGEIDVVLDLPADLSRYGTVKVFALDGNQDNAQSYSCERANFREVSVRTYTKATDDHYPAPSDDAFTFPHGSEGFFSYRLCAWDVYGNLIGEVKKPAVLTGSDSFNRAFAVRGLSGNLGGVSGADAICQNAATEAGLTETWPTWKAVISATGLHAKARLNLSAKIYAIGGLQLYAADAEEMFSADGPRTGIWHDATGSFLGSTDAWTGAAADGTQEANNCQDWTSDSNMDEGRVGYADVYGSGNLSIAYNTCDQASRGGLICISSP